ncbi:hypothetical protein ABZ897_60290 [Nonomuraea sp. NPDC046802]|uniref:hypothetical protein n=1 Tax=Nonomuraea sp. NPDC046802 TaxID=3154919 RepID=UPI0033F0EDF0
MTDRKSPTYCGLLAETNINGIADRLRALLGDQPLVAVSSSPTHHHGIPQVRVGCTLSSPIEEYVVTISACSPSRHPPHYVFVPERGRRLPNSTGPNVAGRRVP